MKRACSLIVLLAVISVSLSSDGLCQTNVGGQFFSKWSFDLNDIGSGKSYNKFDVERVHLDLRSTISPRASFRSVTDVYQKTSTDQAVFTVQRPGYADTTIHVALPRYYDGWAVRMKLAYLELTDYFPKTTFRIGIIPEAWTGKVEALWGYRFVEKTQIDLEGMLATADLGAAVIKDFPRNRGSIQFQIQNGPGYTKPEDNKYKDLSTFVQLNPAPKSRAGKYLTFMGYYRKGYQGATGAGYRRDIWSLAAGYVRPNAGFGIELNNTLGQNSSGELKGRGFSCYGSLNPFRTKRMKTCSLFGRYDSWDPNIAKDGGDNAKTRAIAGVSRQIIKNVRYSIDYQSISVAAKDRGPGTPLLTDSRGAAVSRTNQFAAHFEIKF